MSFPIDQQQIFAATNGGFDIIRRFLPQASEKKHFKIRDEGTESAWISKKDGVYFVRDFGDSGGFYDKSKHAIHIYAKETGNSYWESLVELGRELGIITPANETVKYLTSCQLQEYEGEPLNEAGFTFKIKEFTEYELDTLGPIVTEEHCRKLDFFSLESYSWIKREEGVQEEFCKVFTVQSTPMYPIFAIIPSHKPKLTLEGKEKKPTVEYVEPAWLKIYQPKSGDKKYRFSYLGKKPTNHIFGLERLKNMTEKNEDEKDDEGRIIGSKKVIQKLKNVVICSGDRDALNMQSSGKADCVVWFNSETASIKEVEIKTLFKYAENVINVPDLDPTGVDAGKNVALEHMDVKTAWLPEDLTKHKDFRGNPLKDFTDFMKKNAEFGSTDQDALKNKVARLVELARPARFWDWKYTRSGSKEYTINYMNAFNFLRLNGFYKVNDDNRKDGFYFVKQDKHVIKEVRAQEIKDFFNRSLENRQKEKGMEYYPDQLLNLLLASEAISDKKLAGLTEKTFDYVDYTPDSQFLFFNDFIWEVSKDKIEKITKGYSRYVKQENVINKKIALTHKGVDLNTEKLQIESPLFSIKKDQNGNYDVKIETQECEYMNYVINGSRVFWEKEMENLTDEQQCEYKKTNPSLLTSDKLSEEENYTQTMHFVNKVFTIGYLLHNYKTMSKAWAVIGMDDKIVDEHSSHGRTGKSLTWSAAMRCFKNTKYKGARRKEVLEGQFLFEGVTEETDYLIFDDANEYFRYEELFTDITGDMSINRKNQSEFNLSFYDSPKICITTNFSLKNLSPSLYSRILISSFSNFYHGFDANENIQEFSPRHHYGHDFFSKQWGDRQWFLLINFYAQCLQFYLGTTAKIEAPQENIRKRNLIADLGPIFRQFMDALVANESNLNTILSKDDLYKRVLEIPQLKNYTAAHFKKQVARYCELEGFIFNPQDLWNDQKGKRITQWDSVKRVTEEKFFIRTVTEEPPAFTQMPVSENTSVYTQK